MEKVILALKENPTRVLAILTAGIAVAIAFGMHITTEQQAAILGLALAIFGAGEVSRTQVTPVTKIERKIDEAAAATPGPADHVSAEKLKDKLGIEPK